MTTRCGSRTSALASVPALVLLTLLAGPAIAQDADADGILDLADNCTTAPNRFQLDTDCDGFGDACDADFDQNGIVDLADYAQFTLGAANSLHDVAPPFDGVTDPVDEAAILAALGNPPGPPATPVGGSSPSCEPRHLPGTRFCVTGTSAGTDYAWELSGPGITTVQTNPVPGVPFGAGEQTLMLHIQSSIDAASGTSGVTVTDISLTPSACFALSNSAATLTVGPAGLPTQCTVTAAGCTYNPIIYRLAPTPTDSDADTVPDADDNCTFIPNPLQLDADCDGFGNACDVDFDQNGVVDAVDYALFTPGSTNPVLDVAPPFSGVTDAADAVAVFATASGTVPGPSAANPGSSPSCVPRTLPGPHFCVSGVANGTDYAWQLSGSNGLITTKDPVPAVPPASTAETLMMHLQASIHGEWGNTGVQVTDVALMPNACFALSDPGASLSVGPAGNPTQCTVTPAGCTFNPTVYQVFAAVPLLSPGAGAALAALLCSAAALLIRRARRAGT